MKRLLRFLLILIPIGYAESLWLLNGQALFFPQLLGISLVSLAAFFLPGVFISIVEQHKNRLKIIAGLAALVSVCIVFFFLFDGLLGVLAFLFVSLLASALILSADFLFRTYRSWIAWGLCTGIALFFGFIIVGALQVIERFSEEEFFAAVQLLIISGWWLLLWAVWNDIFRRVKKSKNIYWGKLQKGWLALLIVLIIFECVLVVNGYQASFFPEAGASFPGISAEQPFLCGDLPGYEDTKVVDSQEIIRGIGEQITLNPRKSTAELGTLSLITSDLAWKEAFHQELLKDARAEKYTGPAGSIKYGQYEAAARVYFFHEIDLTNPDLFTAKEKQEILNWFAKINQRSLTVEWVDWMYAFAFREMPKGPYLNQENGAGLIALLEKYHYGDPKLSARNQEYLRTHNFGWNQRFRNTDDSVSYQALWINNALFQAIASGKEQKDQEKKAFEWLLLQAPPDGSPFGYNPNTVSLTLPAYLGAQLTGDERLLWLSGRALEFSQLHGLALNAQPGINDLVGQIGIQPEFGSCLIYGNSGTPVRDGPLAADKIVFRDGWQTDDRYLNLNLRFTGWHRYKATNSIISIYQEEPLVVERTDSPASTWLPIGRSVFRDKRIPRENLNGIVIQRQGVSNLVYWMTGFGSSWAQDPPFYAQVEKFQPGADMDVSVTRLDWNGWTQVRSIYFVHEGPTVVIDKAYGPKSQVAGITWHAVIPTIDTPLKNDTLQLGSSGKVTMRLVPLSSGDITFRTTDSEGQPKMDVLVQSKGRLDLATVFLDGKWQNQEIRRDGDALIIELEGRVVKIPLNTQP
jgi:hypothetical protein